VTGRVACVVPAYCAADTLGGVLRHLRTALPGARVIVVDDGSSDATGAIARELADETIRLEANHGKGAALRAGFDEALRGGHDAILTLDADGQHDPAFGPVLLRELARFDVVIGDRARAGSSMPLRRRMTNAMANAAIARVAGVHLRDTQSGFRAIRRDVIAQIRAAGDRYEFETDFLIRAARAGFRLGNVGIPTVYGSASHFRGVRDSARIVRAIWAHRRPVS
jgi:glycosyltransferase involved in cell wall biosynthesis